MKRCPECRRDYFDDTLSFCLDDGAALVSGPRSDDLLTEILPGIPADETRTRFLSDRSDQTITLDHSIGPISPLASNRYVLSVAAAITLVGVGFLVYWFFLRPDKLVARETPKTGPIVYWQMTDAEKLAFVAERSQHILTLIGDEKTDLDNEAVSAVKAEIDHYLKRKDSLSQKQFEEGLRAVYGRGTQYAPLIIREYEKNRVPPALGLYQAMIETEYHDCPPPPPGHRGPAGMFQFSPDTAAQYGLTPPDYCKVDKQANAAARHMSDLASDFGEGKSNASLGLLSYMYGAQAVREYLRQLRRQGVTERSFWAIFRNRQKLQPPMDYLPPDALPQPISLQEGSLSYVPRFFAAAIIGETPEAFELSTPPLTTLRN